MKKQIIFWANEDFKKQVEHLAKIRQTNVGNLCRTLLVRELDLEKQNVA